MPSCCSKTWYYDEVALRGLQLAAEDAQRGVLLREQLERVKNTIKKLVSELARFRYTQVPTHDLLPLRNRILYPLGMTLADDILSLVTRKPGLTEAEMPSISLAVSAISSEVNSTCRRLIREYRVERRGNGGPGHPFSYHERIVNRAKRPQTKSASPT
jgi:hypothetical protein